MPSKKILAIIGGLVVIAALVMISDYVRDRPVVEDARVGKTIVTDDLAAKANKIVVTKGVQNLTLTRDEAGRWLIAKDGPFPASGKMVATLLETLTGAKIVRLISSAKEKIDSLEISKGDRVALFDKETPLIEIKVGRPRQIAGEGQFISLGNEEKSFLIDKTLKLDADANAWELKTLTDLPKEAIAKVAFFDKASAEAPIAVIARAKKEEPMKLDGAAATDKPKQSELDAAAAMLTGLSFKAKLAPDALASKLWEHAAKAVVTTFDGREYTLKITSEQKTLPPLPPPPEPPKKPGEEAKPQPPPRIETNYYALIEAKGTETPTGDVAFINNLGKNWIFQLDEFVAKRFLKEKTAFLDKP